MNRLYESILSVNIEEINTLDKNRKILLYGFNNYTKNLVFYFSAKGIMIYGFLVDETDYRGKEYLGKKILSMELAYPRRKEYLVTDIIGNNICRLEEKGFRCISFYNNRLKDIGFFYIYGAGGIGKDLCSFLKVNGITNFKLCDKDEAKIGGFYLETEIVSPKELLKSNPKYVIVAHSKAEEIAEEIDSQLWSERPIIYLYDGSREWQRNGLYLEKDPSYIFFSALSILFLRSSKLNNNRKIILYGERKIVIEVIKQLSLFGIEIHEAIDTEEHTGELEHIGFISVYDLFYYKKEKIIVWVLKGYEQSAIRVVNDLGLDKDIFCCTSNVPDLLIRDFRLDPNMGYNLADSIEVLDYASGSNKQTIAVLGGSTTDLHLFPVKPWPQYFCENALQHNKEIRILAGGCGGYMVSQELLKLIRDVIPQKPEIVVSYSGVNELGERSEKNKFVHRYQEEIFNYLGKEIEKSRINIMGYMNDYQIVWGYDGWNYGRHWYEIERMMYAICKEYNIKFYAIAQPTIFLKEKWGEAEHQLYEALVNVYSREWYEEYKMTMLSIRDEVRKHCNDNWLIDFTEIFNEQSEVFVDYCHLSDYGNNLLSERMYRFICEEGLSN